MKHPLGKSWMGGVHGIGEKMNREWRKTRGIKVDYLIINELIEIHGPVADPESMACPVCGEWFAPSRGEKCRCHTNYVEDEFAPF